MREYLGIPFAERGRTREACDCWGLVRLVYREQLGIDLPEPGYSDHRDVTIGGLIDRHIPQWFETEPKRWAVALFRGPLWHVGVMMDSRRMLHVSSDTESRIEHLEPLWLPRLVGYYRYAG